MRLIKQLVFVVLIACCCASLTACYTPAGRSTGTVVDDASITTQIKATLLADELLNGIAISVSTFEGTVTMTGAVKSSHQKQRATDLARSVKGVQKVENLLKIQ